MASVNLLVLYILCTSLQEEQSKFVNRRKAEEEKEKAKPKYPYTIIRLLFEVRTPI